MPVYAYVLIAMIDNLYFRVIRRWYLMVSFRTLCNKMKSWSPTLLPWNKGLFDIEHSDVQRNPKF